MSCFNGVNAILCRDGRYTKIKAILRNALCVVSHVETVDTRDQSKALKPPVNGVYASSPSSPRMQLCFTPLTCRASLSAFTCSIRELIQYFCRVTSPTCAHFSRLLKLLTGTLLCIFGSMKIPTVPLKLYVNSGVCGFYANAYRHTDMVYCIHAPRPSKREGSFKPPVLWQFRK